ncbi:glycoside hydrolase family 3 C-terminal domain-containing protein [Streptomyces sp. NPDC059373]
MEGIEESVAARYGRVVADPADADLAVVRLRTPYTKREGRFESFFHDGRLDFTAEELAPVLALAEAVPTVVDLYLERPAVVPELAEPSAALIGNYGASAEALLDVVFGRAAPEGRLPFEMPGSMKDVEASRPDVPSDTAAPLFHYGHGLTL